MAVQGEKEFDTEFRIIHPNGDIRDIKAYAVVTRDEQGEPDRMIGINYDITMRKRADEKIERFAAFARNNPAPVLRTELDGTISLANPAAKKLLDADVIGQRLQAVLPNAPDLANRRPSGKAILQFEQELSGETLLFSVTWDDKTRAIYIYGSNITETKRLQELESKAGRLEMAGTIAGQVAHDFNNLLSPLMAYPDLIREELPRDHSALEYLDLIEKAAQNIAEINQDLLAMGRRGYYNQEVLNLNTIVQQVVTQLKPSVQTVVIETDLAEDLKDIYGGGAQLNRVLNNLLHNARDAIRDVGEIRIKTENFYVDDILLVYGRVPKGEYVKLTISDAGCGIPDEIVQKIFDPFFTTKSTDKKRGSGLGMSVVDAIIRDHHGYIDLRTEVGEGTSFYVYLPVTHNTVPGNDNDETYGGTETVLVVDDDDIQREVSVNILKKLGYTVKAVESGEKAIEFVRKKPQDLVLLDMIMPDGIDGAETFRQILDIYPHQRAIILSGFSESSRVLEAQRLGAGAFIKKPVTRQAMAAAVRKELDKQASSATVLR